MARIDTLPHFLEDVANSIRSKTQKQDLIAPEDYDTEINSISSGGGGYEGQLPNNSTIERIVNRGDHIEVYLIVDRFADGTRIYYEEGKVPKDLDNSKYIDVPKGQVGIINNVYVNSTYWVKTAAYVIYDENKKVFNAAGGEGSTFVTATNKTLQKAILTEIPTAAQSATELFVDYSPWENRIYLAGTGAGMWYMDMNKETKTWSTFSTSTSYLYDKRFNVNSIGLSLPNSNSKLVLYTNGSTKSFDNLDIGYNNIVGPLSNGDYLAFWEANGTARAVQMYDPIGKSFGPIKYTDCPEGVTGELGPVTSVGLKGVVDTPAGIFFTAYDNNTNISQRYCLFKYSNETGLYEPIIKNISTSSILYDAIPTTYGVTLLNLGGLLYLLYPNNKYKNTGISLSSTWNSKSTSTEVIIEDPNNSNKIFILGGSGNLTLYHLNLDDGSYTTAISSMSSSTCEITLFDNKIFMCSNNSTQSKYYNLSTGASGNAYGQYGKYIVCNNKLYFIKGNGVYKYTNSVSSFSTVATISSANNTPNGVKVIGNKIYFASSNSGGVFVVDCETDTMETLYSMPSSISFTWQFREDGDNIYYLSGSSSLVKQIVISKVDGDVEALDLPGITSDYASSKAWPENEYKGRSSSFYETLPNYKDVMYDSTNKKIIGLGKVLLDLSESSLTFTQKTQTVGNYSYNDIYKYRTRWLLGSDNITIAVVYDEPVVEVTPYNARAITVKSSEIITPSTAVSGYYKSKFDALNTTYEITPDGTYLYTVERTQLGKKIIQTAAVYREGGYYTVINTQITNMGELVGSSGSTNMSYNVYENCTFDFSARDMYMCYNETNYDIGDMYKGREITNIVTIPKNLSSEVQIPYGNEKGITKNVYFESDFKNFRIESLFQMFYNFTELVGVHGLENINMERVTSVNNMLYNCKNLTTLDLSGFDTSRVKIFSGMLQNCSGLTNLNMSGMDTSNGNSFCNMFYGCSKLVFDLSNIDFSNGTSMYNAFYNCKLLQSSQLKYINTRRAINLSYLFYNCTSLTTINASELNIRYADDYNHMFYGCSGITTINGRLKLQSPYDLSYMFNGCSRLTEIDVSDFLLRGHASGKLDYMFNNCSALTTIYSTLDWKWSSSPTGSSVFTNCTSLVGGGGNAYNSNYTTYTYARIGTSGVFGYFTKIDE